MKTRTLFLACLTVLASSAMAQQSIPMRTMKSPPGASPLTIAVQSDTQPEPLTRFNLDFPGGAPKELVAAIEKATGSPLNVIIQEQDAQVRIPPIKLKDVTVPELFSALLQGSYKYRQDMNGSRSVFSSYGFETDAKTPSNEQIWRFFSYSAPQPRAALTTFNLDFPGGTPKELVAAIQKAMGKPLNAIIPEEHAGTILPPLKMNNVDAPQVFKALEQASVKSVAYVTGNYFGGATARASQSYQISITSYGFSTVGKDPTDDSIWYFRVEKPAGPPLIAPKACRFYPLAPYLERGLKVDDITTAIQTGWKMMGDKDTPTISFHKDTKLLIAVGEPGKLETIDAVLKALEPPKPAPAPAPQPKPTGKTDEAPKADE